MHVINFFVESG